MSHGRCGERVTNEAPANQGLPGGLLGRCRQAASASLRRTGETWPGLTVYERFEQAVSLVVTALISVLIVAALVHLTGHVMLLVLFGLADPAEQQVFQAVFGMVMTVLIALLALVR